MSDSRQYTSKLSGARVLVIGGSSGIGYCVAEACLEAGCTVTISSSQSSRIENAIQRLLKTYPSAKDRVTGHACDLASPSLESNIEKLLDKVGAVDHIVFTAGDKLAMTPLQDCTMENMVKGNQIRHFAPILVAKHAMKHFAPGPSSSYTITTGTVSEKPIPGWMVPGAFAASTHSTMRALALDMKPIRVNLVSPGPVETELWNDMPKERFEQFKAQLAKMSATGQLGQPQVSSHLHAFVLTLSICFSFPNFPVTFFWTVCCLYFQGRLMVIVTFLRSFCTCINVMSLSYLVCILSSFLGRGRIVSLLHARSKCYCHDDRHEWRGFNYGYSTLSGKVFFTGGV